jgi:hypothetical protein
LYSLEILFPLFVVFPFLVQQQEKKTSIFTASALEISLADLQNPCSLGLSAVFLALRLKHLLYDKLTGCLSWLPTRHDKIKVVGLEVR